MKKYRIAYTVALLCCIILMSCGNDKTYTANYDIVPLPKSITLVEGTPFSLNNQTKIIYPASDSQLQKTAAFLSDYMAIQTGFDIGTTTEQPEKNFIILKSDLKHENNEAYSIEITPDHIIINGASNAGTFYGIQTLRKSMPAQSDKASISFPSAKIDDYPRFAYRGALIDCARYFHSVESVKKFIDLLAIHNINKMHWHLTNDQGWRIEIKKYPKLTEIGSTRSETVIGINSGKYDGTPHGGFYTQEQAKDIVQYAADRNIEIIPEIDIPGHTLSALAAYGELGCTGGPYEVANIWDIFDDVLCIGNDKSMAFVQDVLLEIMEIFPSKYIHIGGDECKKSRWAECPKCQSVINKERLFKDKDHTAEEKLQSYFIKNVEKFLNGHGRSIIGWDEILEGGLAPNATVMSWRGTEGGIQAAKMGHNVIMTPNQYLYLDYYQGNDDKREPIKFGSYLPIEKVYGYEPYDEKLTDNERKHIIGVQGNLWGEFIPNTERLEYQALPRMGALSCVQWESEGSKDFDRYILRQMLLTELYKTLGYNFATYIFEVQELSETDFTNRQYTVSLSTYDKSPIYYTLDGTDPSANSTVYEAPISINESATLKALTIRDNVASPVFEKTFTVHKSTFKPIKSDVKPDPRYTFDGLSTLVDGKKGGNSYNDKCWIGFVDSDSINFIIDMGVPTEINTVQLNTYVNTGAWIFDITSLAVSMSDDDIHYNKISLRSFPELKGNQDTRISIKQLDLEKPVSARFYKVSVAKQKEIPEWHQGKGSKPFIFIDDIILD